MCQLQLNPMRQNFLPFVLLSFCLSGCGGGGSDSGTAPAPSTPSNTATAPQGDTAPPTITASLTGVQRRIDAAATFGRVDTVDLSIASSDNVGVVKLVQNIEGVSLKDGRSILSATFDEQPVAQPSRLATIDTTAFPLGKYSVVLHGFDAAGNQASAAAVTFYVCDIGPSKTYESGMACGT